MIKKIKTPIICIIWLTIVAFIWIRFEQLKPPSLSEATQQAQPYIDKIEVFRKKYKRLPSENGENRAFWEEEGLISPVAL